MDIDWSETRREFRASIVGKMTGTGAGLARAERADAAIERVDNHRGEICRKHRACGILFLEDGAKYSLRDPMELPSCIVSSFGDYQHRADWSVNGTALLSYLLSLTTFLR
jgi:hypothetical protein